jgi:hypothetical protein
LKGIGILAAIAVVIYMIPLSGDQIKRWVDKVKSYVLSVGISTRKASKNDGYGILDKVKTGLSGSSSEEDLEVLLNSSK